MSARMGAGETVRKTLHVGAGLLALFLPWLTRREALAICVAAVFMNALLLPRVTRHVMERAEDRARGYAAGIIYYPLAVGGLLLLFGSRMEVVAAAWGILAFGDGFATIGGKLAGGPSPSWNPGKTWSGILAFVAAGGAAATGLAAWVLRHDPGPDPSLTLLAAACGGAALVCALVESYPTGFNDNLTVPLVAGGILTGALRVDPSILGDRFPTLLAALPMAAIVNLAATAAAWAAGTVSVSGGIVGAILGVALWLFGGWQSFAILLLFFVLGSGATKLGYASKAARGIAQERGGRRGARNAIANCAVPVFFAFLAAATPDGDLFRIAAVAALATAAFDTVSSEIGQVWGKRPFLPTTLRRVPPGTEGAISVEGTLAGGVAAAVLAGAAMPLGLTGEGGLTTAPTVVAAAIIVAAAFVGATVESYLGALGARTEAPGGSFDNHAMNLLNTAVGGVCALWLARLVLGS
jgi:uncharacterized protein (TIGR00297 family)